MLLEDLLSLPAGTRVYGQVEIPATVRGVVTSLRDGSHFIRWDDGYSTIPLGTNARADEYIAAHTEVVASQPQSVVDGSGIGGTYEGNGGGEAEGNFTPEWGAMLDEDAVRARHG